MTNNSVPGVRREVNSSELISLIVGTRNRVSELDRLLTSLDRQTYKKFEVLIVDQNSDDRLIPVLRQHEELKIVYLNCDPGISRARNIGLRAAQGSIVAIPDDDCWYPEHLLTSVVAWFESHPEFGALFTTMRGADGNQIGPKWPKGPRRCTRQNALHCITAVNGFLRRSVTDAIGFFDENIGPGGDSKYAAGEDADYFLRPFRAGFQMWFEPSLWVGHPDLHDPERVRRTSFIYASASGLVMRTHGYSWVFLGRQLTRSLGGAAVSLCQGDLMRTRGYLARAAGQFRGYCFGPWELARERRSRSNQVFLKP